MKDHQPLPRSFPLSRHAITAATWVFPDRGCPAVRYAVVTPAQRQRAVHSDVVTTTAAVSDCGHCDTRWPRHAMATSLQYHLRLHIHTVTRLRVSLRSSIRCHPGSRVATRRRG